MFFFLVNIFVPIHPSATILRSVCFSRQEKSKYIHFELKKSRPAFDLRSRSDQVKVSKMHIKWCGRNMRVRWCQFHSSGFICSQVIRKNVFFIRLIMDEVKIWPDLRARFGKIRDISFVGINSDIPSWKFHVNLSLTVVTAQHKHWKPSPWHAPLKAPLESPLGERIMKIWF